MRANFATVPTREKGTIRHRHRGCQRTGSGANKDGRNQRQCRRRSTMIPTNEKHYISPRPIVEKDGTGIIPIETDDSD